jgi:hypothetical protein
LWKNEGHFLGRQLLVGGVVEIVGDLRKSLTGVRAQVWRLLANAEFELLDGGRVYAFERLVSPPMVDIVPTLLMIFSSTLNNVDLVSPNK